MNEQSQTPRTDASEFNCVVSIHGSHKVVKSEFARALEKELGEALTKIVVQNKELKDNKVAYSQYQESFMAWDTERDTLQAQLNTCDGTGACADGKCLKCQLVNLQLTNDTLQARVKELEQLYEAQLEVIRTAPTNDQLLLANAQRSITLNHLHHIASLVDDYMRHSQLNEMVKALVKEAETNLPDSLKEPLKIISQQLQEANAQIVVKDEALKLHSIVCIDRCPDDCGECRACKTKQALTNSPAAAKELISELELLRKDQDAIRITLGMQVSSRPLHCEVEELIARLNKLEAKWQETKALQEYQEYHFQGDVGVAWTDNRLWVCIDGQSLFRAKIMKGKLFITTNIEALSTTPQSTKE